MHTCPSDLFIRAGELKEKDEPFVLATVIAVKGSTSARIGAKAIFDKDFRNAYGWVGGGCAESFLAGEARLAMAERRPRIVNVDLDDEVFGLLPCGGSMDVYLEPQFPAPVLSLPNVGEWQGSIHAFVHELGYQAQDDNRQTRIRDWAAAFALIARAIGAGESAALVPRRRGLELPTLSDSRPLIVLGRTRITEEICRLAALLGWPATVYAIGASSMDFPHGTSVCEMPFDFSSVELPAGGWVVVGSHHHLDHEFVAHALRSEAEYVAMIGSRKRAAAVLEALKEIGLTSWERLFVPAGLALRSETPSQIAFSILCEILFLQGRLNEP